MPDTPSAGTEQHAEAPAETVRLRLDLMYDGTGFAGWACQPGLRTVEGELTAGLERILRVSGLKVTTAGRTDAGVHASGAVVHVDVPRTGWEALPGRSTRAPEVAALTRLRGVVAPDVVVRAVRVAPEGFDARFSALRRRYLYRLSDDVAGVAPLRRFDTVSHPRSLDVDAMNEASGRLLGLRDFAAYCRRREGATTIRTLLDYSWVRGDDGVLAGTVVADAFCHSMVRSLVGAVVPVGEGRRSVDWPAEVLSVGLRDSAVTVMPAHGLSLEEVVYPPDGELAARAVLARARRDA